MDQHPIPQDVTGFQFKLIGTMTVKQFGYVACGVIFAVILYYMPLNSALGVLLKIFLIPFLGASGVIVAFVPVDGRPIDVMATNFVKAIFSPNQYVYHRQGRKLSFLTVSVAKIPVAKKTEQKTPQQQAHIASTQLDQKEEKLRALLLSSSNKEKTDMDKKEAAFLKALTLPTTSPVAPPANIPVTPRQSSVAPPTVKLPITTMAPIQQQRPTSVIAPVAPPTPVQLPTPPQISPATPPSQPAPTKDPNILSKKESELTQELNQAKQEDSQSRTPALYVAAQQKITSITKQIQEVHAQKQQLEKELSSLQNQLISQKTGDPTTTVVKSAIPQQPLQDPQHVRVIPQAITKKAGLPHVSDSPNVVVGIVKDPRGNILPNILVEVKDKEGNPVRAFKTNQLGQFASATPLSPGTYTIELEDPKKQQKFDLVQITANNQILLPIEIISHDAREELRKQLFAN